VTTVEGLIFFLRISGLFHKSKEKNNLIKKVHSGIILKKSNNPVIVNDIYLESVYKSTFSFMPDLIRHPEGLEKTGFRLSPE